MNKLPDHITEDLLAKYFSGETSSTERKMVEDWRDSESENRELLLQYEMLWQDLGIVRFDGSEQIDVNVDEAWEQLQSQKFSTETSVSVPKSTWLKIAASIILVLGLFAVINQLGKTEKLISQRTDNSTAKFQLADGSQIILNRNSEIQYPEKFEASRKVKLSGEAFFDVEHNPENPFEIEMAGAKVTVLGTSFNLKSSITTDTVTVFVETGKVSLSYQADELILNPGQKGVLYKSQNKLFIEETQDETGLVHFWRTGLLTFNGQQLSEVVGTLSRAYEENIQLGSAAISSCRINTSFENETLENVLEVIALTLRLEIEKTENEFILTGEECEP